MTKRKTLLTAVIIALVLLFAVSGGILFVKHIKNQKAEKKYEALASSYAHLTQASGETAATDASGKPLPPNPVDFASLQAQNPEIYSWINVEGTEVDYPVLQSETDDNFYIDHDYEKQSSAAGAIFSQFCNRKDYSDRVTVLYGHNMANNSMFASLHSFEDADFFDAHEKITVYTPDRQLDYQIISAYVYSDTHIMNSYDFSSDEVYREFQATVLEPRSVSSRVREGVTLTTDDRLLILSTCLNYGDGRYLVVGRLTGETALAPSAAS